MGCVIYCVLSHGKHPFGDLAERQDNIKHENFSLTYLDEKDHDKVMAKDLVNLMINKNYKLRYDFTVMFITTYKCLILISLNLSKYRTILYYIDILGIL